MRLPNGRLIRALGLSSARRMRTSATGDLSASGDFDNDGHLDEAFFGADRRQFHDGGRVV